MRDVHEHIKSRLSPEQREAYQAEVDRRRALGEAQRPLWGVPEPEPEPPPVEAAPPVEVAAEEPLPADVAAELEALTAPDAPPVEVPTLEQVEAAGYTPDVARVIVAEEQAKADIQKKGRKPKK